MRCRARGLAHRIARMIGVWCGALVGACNAGPARDTAVPAAATSTPLAGSGGPSVVAPVDAEALAAATPGAAARVTDTHEASAPGMPVVVVVRDAHLNDFGLARDLGFAVPTYTSEQRLLFGKLALEVLQVEEALLGAGVIAWGAEAIDTPLDATTLGEFARLLPDLAGILAAPPEERRALAQAILGRGSPVNAWFVLAALHPEARVEGVETQEAIARMLLGADRLTRLERATDEAADPFSGLRALVLAGAASPVRRAEYERARKAALAVLEEYDGFTVRGRSRGMADGALALAARAGAGAVGLLCGGFHAESVVERLAERGAGWVVVEPATYPRVGPNYGIWLAGLRARFPPAPPSAAPEAVPVRGSAAAPPPVAAGDGVARPPDVRGTSTLPPLDPWLAVMWPLAAAIAEAGAFPALRAVYATPPPVPLPAADPLRGRLLAAAERLRRALVAAPFAAEVLGNPVATVAGLRLCRDPPSDTAMSYDGLHHALKAARWLETLTEVELAAVLAHELVHEADTRRRAAALGISREEHALVLDALGLAAGSGLHLHDEDRAMRVELLVSEALGVAWPDAVTSRRLVADVRTKPADRLRATLGNLAAARTDPVRWLRQLAAAAPPAFRPRIP